MTNEKGLTRASAGPIEVRDEREELLSYLRSVRKELEDNPEARETVAAAEPAAAASPELVRILSSARPGREVPILRPGTEDLLTRAVGQVLAELEVQRRGPKGLYLVDESTGKSVLALPEGAIYQPPDYVGEDGLPRKAMPIVHPGLSSSLVMKQTEDWKVRTAIERSEKDEMLRRAYEHLTDPEKMAAIAGERLRELGVLTSDLGTEEPEEEIEFGREHVGGVFQSPNPGFHRLHLFAGSIVRRVMARCGPGAEVRLGRVKEKSSGKQRWYTVGLTVRRPPQLSSG